MNLIGRACGALGNAAVKRGERLLRRNTDGDYICIRDRADVAEGCLLVAAGVALCQMARSRGVEA